MTEKCEAASRAAGKPATGPTAAETTGTSPSSRMIDMKLGGAFTGAADGGGDDWPLAGLGTEPPPPSRKRTSGMR